MINHLNNWISNQTFLYSIMLLLVAIFILAAIGLFYTIKRQKPPVSSESEALEKKIQDLKEQLLTVEKTASMGILSAGIAHEVKNPLNFINNFSEMTIELIQELKTALTEALETLTEESKQNINGILEDISINCEKINEHGKRAESIIKNMLIHARTANIEKEPLEINTILEQYLNLSYHGMRAQNNKFNIKIEKDLDNQPHPISANQQSLGRVFLNIFSNAFYAADEKSQKNAQFMPTIRVTTRQDNDYVIIKIKDNGNGIPKQVQTKIFEPFFTTKPVGKGTGLGLPICHDIIVNEHSGKLEVNSVEGEFTEFTIMLPKEKSGKE